MIYIIRHLGRESCIYNNVYFIFIQISRKVSQTRWVIDDERMGEASVEVRVRNLTLIGSEAWTLMREGEAEKQLCWMRNDAAFDILDNICFASFLFIQKQYAAVVWFPRPLTDDDLQKISSLKNMDIVQRTPIRVLHRRSQLERKRTIHWYEKLRTPMQYFYVCCIGWMMIERISGSSQYFLLHLCTQ
ncbi:hypothetical protein B296_00009327, partial [Ensete ventricosum]